MTAPKIHNSEPRSVFMQLNIFNEAATIEKILIKILYKFIVNKCVYVCLYTHKHTWGHKHPIVS